ncbi:aminotransferase class I/II-fold pyridoxal phosphate-dependent enzyme [Streptomyces sp. NPDC045369]|uniref:pyridoxal phosphate-dependent aminotransferase n=1 Tax=Streptomyces sp. NPDC045369 TaxID=3155732 RepID=UPI0033C19DC4
MTTLAPTAVTDQSGNVVVLSTGDIRVAQHDPGAVPAARRADQPYRSPAGDLALREAITAYAADGGTAKFTPDQVVVTPGARQAIFTALLSVLRGDRREVLLPTPYWASFPRLVEMAGGTPVPVPTEPGQGAPSLEALARLTTGRTAMLILNSPRNPDGAVVSAEELRGLTEWTAERGLTLLFDQVYRGVALYEEPAPTVTQLYPELPGHVVLTDAVTKSHALAGLRLGWAVAGPDTATRITATASHLIGGASGVVQDIAQQVLTTGEPGRRELGARLATHLDLALDALAGIPGVHCARPAGGIFLFPDLRGWLADSAPPQAREDVVGWLRARHEVAVVDGAAFGAPGRLRLSFALPADQLKDGLHRLRTALTRP